MKKALALLFIVIILLFILTCCSSADFCTVTFDSQKGSAIESQRVEKGGFATKPNQPTRQGYSFVGWYTQPVATDGTLWRFDGNSVQNDITLYAHWVTQTHENQEENNSGPIEVDTMYITINGNKLEVELADNSSVDALIQILQQGDIIYTARDYGGFEKVGNLGHTLPTNNTQITTQAGDVILYSGNQIVLFYGSNSWSYTRLGKINGYTSSQLGTLLGAGLGSLQVTVSLN